MRVVIKYPYWPYTVFKVHRGTRGGISAVRSLKTEQRSSGLMPLGARSTF
jgi:hypothetical protein